MTLSTLDKLTVSKIASGTASHELLESVPREAVWEVKSSAILQRRVGLGSEVLRAADDESRVIEWAVSDETPDRMGDIIRVSGWDLKNYKKNPVVLWGHDQSMDHSMPAIGRALKTAKGERAGGTKALIQSIEFASAEDHPFANTVYQLAKKGFLRATSVGFLPMSTKRVESDEERAKLGLGAFGVIYDKQELLENSVVNVPANPSALQLAMDGMVRRGVITSAAARTFVAEAMGEEPDEWFGKAKTLIADFGALGDSVRAIFEGTGEGDSEAERAEEEVGSATAEEVERVAEAVEQAGIDVLLRSRHSIEATVSTDDTNNTESAETGGTGESSVPASGATDPVGATRSTSTGGNHGLAGADAADPSDSVASTSHASAPVLVTLEALPSAAAPTPNYTLLVGALARLIEQETERTAATMQLVDSVTDLARKVVSMADARSAMPVAAHSTESTKASPKEQASDGPRSDGDEPDFSAARERAEELLKLLSTMPRGDKEKRQRKG